MGTWGPGNLDNDHALDILGDRSHELTARVLAGLAAPINRDADEPGHAELFVDLEVMLALAARELFTPYDLPEPAAARRLCDDFFGDWAASMDELEASPDFKAERRAVIEVTFERFVELCGLA